jgi:hypothetical protein
VWLVVGVWDKRQSGDVGFYTDAGGGLVVKRRGIRASALDCARDKLRRQQAAALQNGKAPGPTLRPPSCSLAQRPTATMAMTKICSGDKGLVRCDFGIAHCRLILIYYL